MKLISIVLLSVIFPVKAISQQFNVSIKDDLKYGGYSDEGQFGNKFYSLYDIVNKYSSNSKLVVNQKDENNETILKSSPNPLPLRVPKIARLMQTGGKLYMIYLEREKNLRTTADFMASEIDTSSLEIGPPRTIAEFSKNGYNTRPATGWEQYDRDYFERSPDSSKLLFFIANEKFAADVYISVTDKNLNVLWERTEHLDRANRELSIKRATVDNNGNVYLAYKLVESKKRKFPTTEINHIVIYNNKKQVIDKTFDLGDAQMKEVVLKISPKNDALLFGGFYFTTDYSRLQGAFSGQLSLTDYKTAGIKKELFPRELVEELTKEGWGSTKKKYGISSDIVPNVITLPDGSFGLIGEFHRVEHGEKASYSITGSVLYVNLTDKTPLFSRIPKVRVSAGSSSGDSYSAFSFEDKIIVFYNDKDDNLKKNISEAPERSDVYKNVVLVAAIIDKNGIVKREKVVDLQKENFMALTRSIHQEKKNIFMVTFLKVKSFGGFKSEAKLARIEVK